MTNEALALAIQKGDSEKIIDLWEQVKGFAFTKARRWLYATDRRGGLTFDDLMQSAFIAALCTAIEYKNVGKGPFLRWFDIRLSEEFTKADGLYTEKAMKDPINRATSFAEIIAGEGDDALTLGDTIADPNDYYESVDERDRMSVIHNTLRKAVNDLPRPQARAIYRFCRYPEKERYKNKNLKMALEALRNNAEVQALQELM